MDTKKNVQMEVEVALKKLTQKIESLKERVDKLCETSDCFKTIKTDAHKKSEK